MGAAFTGIDRRSFAALLAGVALFAVSAPALAQSEPPADPVPTSATAEADSSDGEIVVTAQFRAQNLQDVPISVSAVSAEQLRLTGANNLKDLQYSIPNVTFAGESFAGNPKVVIRGLYINTRTTGLEPSFGVYVDGVFQGRPIAYDLDLVDVERIEYLRGPQGSLYGKNTISGAINVVTQKPGDEFEGYVTADYGNLDYYKLAGTVRGPLIADKLGFKLTGYKIGRDGFVDNVNPGGNDPGEEDRYGGAATLRLTPSEDLEILFTANGMKEDRTIYLGEASNVAIAGSPPFNAAGPLVFGRGLASLLEPAIAAEPFLVNHDTPHYEDRYIFGASATVNYGVGDFTLTSISAYREASDEWGADDDYSSFDINRVIGSEGKFDQFTQELRLTSPGNERFNYVVGAFYLGSDIYQDRRQRTGDGTQVLTAAQNTLLDTTPYPSTINGVGGRTFRDYYNFFQVNDSYTQVARGTIDNYALYGQVDFQVTDALNLFAGLRYSIEEKQATYVQQAFRAGVPVATNNYFGAGRTIPLVQTDKYTDKKLSPSVGAKYDVNDDLNLFVRYAQGFKGTGFNFGNGLGNPTGLRGQAGAIPLLPEEVDSYEAGIKAQLFDRALTANLTYFYQKGKNLQISAFLPDLTRPAFNTNAKVQGFELELAARPLEVLQLGFNVGFTDTICVGGGAAAAIGGVSRFNATCTKGVDLENVSKWNLSGNATLQQPITEAATLIARLDAFYRDRYLGGSYFVDGFAKVDARVGVEFESGLAAFAWGKNLFDNRTIGNSFGNSVIGATPPTGTEFIETFDIGRTYGVTLEYRF